MEMFFAAMSIIMMAMLVWFLWYDYKTSGKWLNGRDIVGSVVLVIMLIIINLPHLMMSREMFPLIISMIIFSLARTGQYLWYHGPLRRVRRKRVKDLQAKWREELFKIQNVKLFPGNSEKDHARIAAREKQLIWRIRNILP